ncbi:MAG: hypothetical protein NWF10_04535 [Candidatus Bathyarchaeota archaeon]|nr:hypothetical protein [Candidatus Bathyarchaeota archaeon]
MSNKEYRTIVGLFLFFLIIQTFLLPVSHSAVSYTATVFIDPQLAKEDYIWVFGSDDFVHKLNKSDLEGPELLAWDTGTGFILGGCEFRLEDGNEYIYVIDSGTGANSDMLIKFHADNGTELSRWDISGYSENSQGLVWNGSRWFIVDSRDDLIYQVDPNNPTIAERSFSYSGQRFCGGLAWDGLYLWAVDYGTDRVYQMDVYGVVLTSWNFAPLNPAGATYDGTSGNLWIVDRSGYLHEYYLNGTLLSSWDVTRAFPKGIAFSSTPP